MASQSSAGGGRVAEKSPPLQFWQPFCYSSLVPCDYVGGETDCAEAIGTIVSSILVRSHMIIQRWRATIFTGDAH